MLIKNTPEDLVKFAPDEPPSASTSDVSPETSTPTPSAPTAAETPAPSPAVTTTPAPQSWLAPFQAEGFSETDENKARQALLQGYWDSERLRPLAPALSAYQQHAQEFHSWLANKQKPSVVEDWTKKFYDHPEWNPSWTSQISQDDKGNLIPAPGAPADIVLKYQNAQNYRKEFIERFLTNPAKTLEPIIRHLSEQVASQHSQQNVGQYKEHQEAQQFIQTHGNWLFDKGSDGSTKTVPVFNSQTGRHENQNVLSSWGKLFVENLQVAAHRGLSPDMQQDYAMKAVQNAYMSSPEYIQWAASQYSQAPSADTAETARQRANDAFNKKANPAVAPTARGGNATPAPQKVTRENLEQVMLQRLQESGASTQ